jgi:hypothetical protein
MGLLILQGDFNFVDWFHSCVFHGFRCAVGCEEDRNLTDESVCMTADNVRNEVVTDTGGVENAVFLHEDILLTGRRCSDLPFEVVLQEYLQFPYE